MPKQRASQFLTDFGVSADSLEKSSWIEQFDKVPGILGDTTAAATYVQGAVQIVHDTNPRWMVAGTNSTSALCAAAVGGGVSLTTAGSAVADQTLLTPNTNGANLNTLEPVKFTPSAQPAIVVPVTTDAMATTQAAVCGFSLTRPAPFNTTTDADRVEWRYDTATGPNWIASYSVGGTDTDFDTGIAVAASTTYQLGIFVDADGQAHLLLDGKEEARTGALTAAAAFIPSVGIQAQTAAAVALYVRKIALAKAFGTN